MEKAILVVVNELREEAAAVEKYTNDIAVLGGEASDTTVLLEKIRMDEVEHIQKLTLELTRLILGEGSPDVSGEEEK